MKLPKPSSEFFSPERRQEILDYLIHQFKQDPKIAGAILVGSGAYGFTDEYSDIDFSIITYAQYDVKVIFHEWYSKLLNQLEIIHSFDIEYNPDNFLMGLFLEDFLELNIGFQKITHVFAKRKHWKVLFDKTDSLSKIMEDSWKQNQENRQKFIASNLKFLVNGSWHYVNSTVIALSRENYWRVIRELDILRTRIIDIVAMRYDIKVTSFLDSEHMTEDFRRSLSETLIPRAPFDKKEFFEVIRSLTTLYYAEANKSAQFCNSEDFHYLEKRMNDYLAYAEKRIIHQT